MVVVVVVVAVAVLVGVAAGFKIYDLISISSTNPINFPALLCHSSLLCS